MWVVDDNWKKRRWVGFEVAQQGVRSMGCGFRLVSAVRRGRAWGVSMFGIFAVVVLAMYTCICVTACTRALELWEICRAVSAARAVGGYICLGT